MPPKITSRRPTFVSHSSELQTDYAVTVDAPDATIGPGPWPLVLFMDGDYAFDAAVRAYRSLREDNAVPPAVIAAIGYGHPFGSPENRRGRDYTPTFLNAVTLDPFGYVGVATLANVRTMAGSPATTTVRASNMVSYFLPSLGGVYGQVSVAAGENATGNKYAGGRIGYAAGPINVMAAYGKTYKTGIMIDDLKVANIGASYDFGVVKLMAVGEQMKYSTAQQKLASIAAVVPFGASTVKLAYTRSTGSATTVADAFKDSIIGIGYQYNLSKRTALYANYGRNANGNNAKFTSSGGGNAPISTGFTSTGYELGINHAF